MKIVRLCLCSVSNMEVVFLPVQEGFLLPEEFSIRG